MERSCFLTKEQSKALRGIAALMVIASHYLPWYTDLVGNGPARLGVYGVNLFFLVSGYGLAKSASCHKPGRAFWKSRLCQLYLPYLLIVGAIELYAGGLRSLKSWYIYLTGYDYWYVRNALLFYLLFFGVCRLSENRHLRAVLLAAGVFGYSWWLVRAGRADFWYVSNIAFVLGFLAGTYEKELLLPAKKGYAVQIAVLLAGVLWTAECVSQNRLVISPDSVKIVTGVAASAVWALFALQAGCLLGAYTRALQFLGSLSLELYLSHMFLYFRVINDTPIHNRLLQVAVSLLLTLIFSWLFHWAMGQLISKAESWVHERTIT